MKLHRVLAQVKAILYTDADITIFTAYLNNKEGRCINYNHLTGSINEKDRVILNTTAVDLGLGTGGYHFVMAVCDKASDAAGEGGRSMKLNYSPMQLSYTGVESEESEYHKCFDNFTSLNGMPVIIGSLHSMLAPAALGLHALGIGLRICYIMTDGAALPIWISNTTRALKNMDVIYRTITSGNAFGGDIECVNIYSALIAAKEAIKADAAIVCMGPGIIGTATKYGHRGLEQGQIIDAVNTLHGTAIAIPRISFCDKRERHWGISHHSITALAEICKTSANIAIPNCFDMGKKETLNKQLIASGIEGLHKIFYVDISDLDSIFTMEKGLLDIMGRSYPEDKEYFLTCGAAAKLVEKLL